MTKTFITTILFLATLAIGFFSVKPEWDKFQNLRHETAELKDLSAEVDGLIENRDAIIQLINSISSQDLDRIAMAIPQEAHSSEFLVFLESLSAKNGLVLRQLDLAGKETLAQTPSAQPRPGGLTPLARPEGAIQEVSVFLSASGSYENMKRFLGNLEKNLRIIEVSQLSFPAPSKARDAIEFSIKMSTYYQ